MRSPTIMAPATLLATLSLLISQSALTVAKPARLRPAPLHLDGRSAVDSRYVTLLARQDCSYPCGFGGWLCCSGAGQCYTDSNNQAQCGAGVTAAAAQQGSSSGYWEFWTSTWVETDTETRTAVYSSWVGAPATVTPASCAIPCGSNCCSDGYYCLVWSTGECALQGSTPGGITPAATGPSPSAPLRPTSSGVVVVTGTSQATTTVPFESAVPTGANVTVTNHGHGGGLSGGAIAGIVIGVLAGIVLLFLICLFCCARALFDTILAIFGLGKKRRHTHEETYIEEHHHSGGSAGGGRWYGQNRPGRPPKKEGRFSGLGGAAGVGAALAALAVILGLKRRHDRKHEEKSDYTSTYYSSDYTSSSSASSDRHTRRTHDTRRTRDTRRSSHRSR